MLLEGIVVIVVSVAIVVSNTINLVVWSRVKGVSRTTLLFFLNLSVSDLLVGVVACAPSVYPSFAGSWPYGAVWCQISGVTHGTSVTISIWSISMIGIDRYVAVSNPHTYRHLASVRGSVAILTGLWTAAIVTFVAPILFKRDFVYYKYRNAVKMCGMHWEYPAYCVITGMYIPVASGCVLVYTVLRIRAALARERDTLRMRCNRRVFNILVAASLTYFACWGPYVILVIVTAITSLRPPGWLSFCSAWLANANSFVNVFVYSASSPAFRRGLRELGVYPAHGLRPNLSETVLGTDNNDGNFVDKNGKCSTAV